MGPTRSAESAPGKNRISLWIEASSQRPQRKDLAFPPAFVCDPRMDQFIARHVNKLQGTLSCFDRVLFRGYLPFFSGYAMASFLESRGIYRRDVKRFVLTQAYRLKDHARQLAARAGRPYQYFGERTRKEDLARQLAERDGIQEGLICVFATVEPCRTSSCAGARGRRSSSPPAAGASSSTTTTSRIGTLKARSAARSLGPRIRSGFPESPQRQVSSLRPRHRDVSNTT
jgi:hypothetical protein